MLESTEKKLMKKNTDFYNVLRIFAILTVVIGHSTYAYFNSDGGVIELNSSHLSQWYYSLVQFVGGIGSWIYGFHMALFFALSGALYTYSSKKSSFSEIITAKVKRLVLPYYLVGIFYMFPIKLLSGFYNKETFFKAAQSFLFGGCSGHLLFLLSLFWCFLLMYIFEKYVARRNFGIACVIVCCLFNFNLNANFSGMKYFIAIPSFSSALNYFPYFFGGYAFEELRKKMILTKFWVWTVFIIFLVANIIQYKLFIFDNLTLRAILGIVLFYCLSLILAEHNGLLNNRIFIFFLQNAMNIYLFHDPLNYIIIAVANKTNLCATDFGSFFYIFMRNIGVIIISCIIGEVCRIACLKENKKFFVIILLFWCSLLSIRFIVF